MKPRFITLEGGEGAGKTTLAKSLKQYLESKGLQVVITREPGGTALGEEIRSLLLEQKSLDIVPRAELFLFLAARAQHIDEVIIPALRKGMCVISDRFSDSTIAYQGGGRRLGIDYVSSCTDLVTEILPDVTFYLDIDPSIAGKRLRARSCSDRIEQEKNEFHKRVRMTFLELAKAAPKRIFCIDATRTKKQVLDEAKKRLTPFLRQM